MRLFAMALIALGLALPARAEIVENEMMKVFDGHWVQSKDPSQFGALMFLTQERAAAGEYFTIRCVGADRSIRIGFPKRQNGGAIGITIDGTPREIEANFTGRTKDRNFLKGNIFSYELEFDDAAAQSAFLEEMRAGRMLTVNGQSLPISLAGAGQAVAEQAVYCR